MGAIQFTDRGSAVRVRPETRTLTQAAVAALPAPSIFNSQPWRWRISNDLAQLRADRARQLRSVDPDGRMLTVSCGIALHHALTTLAAKGAKVRVERFPDPDDPDLFATIRVEGAERPDPTALRMTAFMTVRRTDRRPFAEVRVPPEKLELIRAAAEAVGAHLHVLRSEDVLLMTAAATRAATAESTDPEYRADLRNWTRRDSHHATDGLPAQSSPADGSHRPVPLRVFAVPDAEAGRSAAGSAFVGGDEQQVDRYSLPDRSARYAVLFMDSDAPKDWLTAGEALSAVLLTAVGAGLAASPMSDVVEVPATRHQLRAVLSGIGYPVIAIRFGVPVDDARPAFATPRRAATDVIEVSEPPAGDAVRSAT